MGKVLKREGKNYMKIKWIEQREKRTRGFMIIILIISGLGQAFVVSGQALTSFFEASEDGSNGKLFGCSGMKVNMALV